MDDDDRLPLFCDTGLGARIERAEVRMVAEAAEASRRRTGQGQGRASTGEILIVPIAGGVAVWGGEASPINKVAGLGFAGVPDEAELAEIERAFAERRAPVRIELASLAQAGIAPLLTGRGYHLLGFENVLGRRLPIDPAALAIAPGVAVAECGPAQLEEWLDVVITGFAQPDTQGVPSGEQHPRALLEEVFRDMLSMTGFVRHVARLGGELAGAASLRVCDGIAQLAGAATLPRHRRHGIQSSLLAARLAGATLAGCDVAVVTTEPGSKSQENVQRRGFDLLYTRAVLSRDPVPPLP
jgi:GNAT superfamily N-acetyltransferase